MFYEEEHYHTHGHHHHHHHDEYHHTLSPLRGLLHLAILKVISEGPIHGGEIQRRINERFNLNISKAMIYGLLRRLEHHNLVISKWITEGGGPAKRIYYITEEGLTYLSESIEKLRRVKPLIDMLISSQGSA